MCNQTVGLIAAELERHDIPTVVIQILRMVAEKVGPPRSLCVPYKHGYPLGMGQVWEGRATRSGQPAAEPDHRSRPVPRAGHA